MPKTAKAKIWHLRTLGVNLALQLQEAKDIATLVNRISPNLLWFLPSYYPDYSNPNLIITTVMETLDLSLPKVAPDTQPTALKTQPPIWVIIDPKMRRKDQMKMANLDNFMVLGIIREQGPRMKRLLTWAKSKLYRSFQSLIMKENNYVKVQFSQEEGVKNPSPPTRIKWTIEIFTFILGPHTTNLTHRLHITNWKQSFGSKF
jgi:hypothetical protein